MKKTNNFVLLLALLLGGCTITTQQNGGTIKLSESDLPEDTFNFLLVNDAGRNGWYDQKPIAAEMGRLAEEIDIEFVASAGDLFHYLGVQSIADPLWLTNYELIYDHPELQIDWHPALGNHEYHGNTQSVIDYTGVSRRWEMPARYYTKSFKVEDGATLRVLWIDTAPLIDKYHRESDEYPDVARQDGTRELAWIDSVLTASAETWKVVIGHHPIYAETSKDDDERTDLQKRLDPILRKHGVDLYLCGHIHNFQHIRRTENGIDYVVNSSASQSRKVASIEGTQFCSSETGFSVVSATPDSLKLYMLDRNAALLHTVRRGK